MDSPVIAAGTILGMSKSRFFTIILIVLVLGFAAFKLRPYFAYLSSLINTIRILFDSTVTLAADTSTGIVDNAAAGTDVIIDKVSGTSHKHTQPTQSNKSNPPKQQTKPSPEPDDTSSSVQSKSGYCYVGDWKGVKSCVRVNGGCASGKVFKTEEECTR